MGTGYTRNDVSNNIADGNVINASDLDGEFDAIQGAFNGSTGHSHDGTTGEGPPIDTAGLADDAVTAAKLDETESYTVAGLTVTGNTTLGDAATDTVTFTADVASNILPNADGTLSLGAAGESWGDAYVTTLYVGGTEVTSTATELNVLDGITSTTAELNILDGVTSTSSELNLVDGSTAGTVVNSKAVIYGASGEVNATTLQVGGVAITATPTELNTLDGITATTAELNILDGVTSTSSELNLVDGSVAGTVVNNKAVVYGASGEVNATTLQVGGVSITATPTELNTLDGITASTAELNVLDGITATTTELNYTDGVTSAIQTQLDGKQPLDAQLTDIAGLTPTDGNFIVGDGTNFVAESGSTARTSLGLGTLATLNEVDASTIQDNSVGADELNVSGDGTAGQALLSDGDGSFSWGSAGSDTTNQSKLTAFTSPGTWTKPADIKAVKVTVVGGGGASRTDASAATLAPANSSSFGAFCTGSAGGIAPNGGGAAGGAATGGDLNMGGGSGAPNTGGGSFLGNQNNIRTSANLYGGGSGHANGGGGGGGTAIKWIPAPSIPGPVTVTVGTGAPVTGPGPLAPFRSLPGAPGAVVVEEFY